MLFTLKKVVAPFLLPPGIFILLSVLAGVVLTFRRRWRSGMINWVIGLALWSLSIGPVANFLMSGLEAGFAIPEHPTGDVIILLGGGIIGRVPDLTGPGAPTPLMMGRIVTAVRLYRILKLPIIVTGGRVFEHRELSEAPVVKRFLVDLGVPAEAILIEDRARDTAQNARFTAVICEQRGFSRPILLTGAYHLKRAQMAFTAAGLAATPFPAYFFGQQNVPWHWMRLLPSAGSFWASTIALHEYLGILYYRMVEL